MTETAMATRGVGVVDPLVDKDDSADNDATLKSVMRSKGLAGVFDHNFVEPDSRQKSATVREMEERAKKVARDAMKALRESVEQEPERERQFGAGPRGGGSSSLSASLKSRQASIRSDAARRLSRRTYRNIPSCCAAFGITCDAGLLPQMICCKSSGTQLPILRYSRDS